MTTINSTDNIENSDLKAQNSLPFDIDCLLNNLKQQGTNANINDWADFWRYYVGIDPIPADTKNKVTNTSWSNYQNNPVSEIQHKEWKTRSAFNNGIAIIVGKIHRGPFEGRYLASVDIDNNKGIIEFLSQFGQVNTLEKLAEKTIVEQHLDNKDKAHIYFIVEKPLSKKSGVKGFIAGNEVPAMEVKSEGSHGIMFCTPSPHKNGHYYQIIGTRLPTVLNFQQSEALENSINQIYANYNTGGKINNGLTPIEDLFKVNFKIYQGNNRHLELLRIMESLIQKLKNLYTEDEIKKFAEDWNEEHCEPPLDIKEFDKQWNCAKGFVKTKAVEPSPFIDNISQKSFSSKDEQAELVEVAAESILSKVDFITIEESQEILCYRDGVYIHGGEILIERMAEEEFGYLLYNNHLSEIKGHIKRKTYVSIKKLDSHLEIINLKNGLYNWKTNEFRAHDPSYLSNKQLPILYDEKAKPNLFGNFLKQVLYPTDIRTVIEAMAYTFYRDCPFEHYFKLFGDGANGKSVFTGLLTKMHGDINVSNVSLSSLVDNRFALSDLEYKNVNVDAELSTTAIKDTSLLKKLTGGRKQPIRIERKYQKAYDIYIYAKLFFNTNKITNTPDQTDAYYRREIIISFPNKFEGKNEDPYLLEKLSSSEEISGIFNVLMKALRDIMQKDGIYLNAKTIEERRLQHDRAVNPVKAFMEEAIDEESAEFDFVVKLEFYNAFKKFIKKYSLASKSIEAFGKELKKLGKEECRKTIGENRYMCWKGVRLKDEYDCTTEQQLVTVWT